MILYPAVGPPRKYLRKKITHIAVKHRIQIDYFRNPVHDIERHNMLALLQSKRGRRIPVDVEAFERVRLVVEVQFCKERIGRIERSKIILAVRRVPPHEVRLTIQLRSIQTIARARVQLSVG